MLPNNDELIRRTKVSTKRINNKRDEDSSRKKEHRRIRRLHVESNRTFALVFVASLIFSTALLFQHFRTQKKQGRRVTERYERAKALSDVIHRGGKNGLRAVKDLGGMRYLDPRQLPPLPGEPDEPYTGKGKKGGFHGFGDDEWKAEAQSQKYQNLGPKVDYTKHKYQYPKLAFEPLNDGSYPPLEPMSSIFETWGQDNIDNPPDTLVEVLQHFDYLDPEQMKVRQLIDHVVIINYTSVVELVCVVFFVGCDQV